jgi:signal transduction histidine kinase
MNNALIKEYYLKLLFKYSLVPTFILIVLLSVTSLTYDKYVMNEAIQNTLSRNRTLADQILQNFNHSTGIIAKSSFSSIALRFGDFTGYRSVVVPWISDDKSIEGLVMFDQEHKPVLTWPSDLANTMDVSKIQATAGLQSQGERLIVSHDVFDNTERLGSLAFITDSNTLGLNQLNLSLKPDQNCQSLQSASSLYVCAGEANNQKLLFSIITILISALGLLIVFFFSISRLSVFLSKPVNVLLQGLNKMKEGQNINWKGMFDPASAPVFQPIGEHFSETLAQVKELNSNLEYKSRLSEMAKKLAHDIRSPLTALNIAARAAESQREPARDLMTTAIKRINDISLDLLKTAKAEISGAQNSEITDLHHALSEVVMEKRIQHKNQILFQNEVQSLQAFINESDFKCSISNLINNAIEASPESASIEIRLKAISDRALIEIQDQGSGIAPHVLAKLGRAPVTEGKTDSSSGSGIGVYNASKLFHNAQGSLRFDSVMGQGTRVLIELPLIDQVTAKQDITVSR